MSFSKRFEELVTERNALKSSLSECEDELRAARVQISWFQEKLKYLKEIEEKLKHLQEVVNNNSNTINKLHEMLRMVKKKI
jgi:chromosome segregation ATPase